MPTTEGATGFFWVPPSFNLLHRLSKDVKSLRFLWSVCLIVSPTITSCLFIMKQHFSWAKALAPWGPRGLQFFSQNNTFVTQMSLAWFLCTGRWLTLNTLKIEGVSQPYSFNWGGTKIWYYKCDFHKTTSSNQASQAVGPYSLVLQTHHRSHHSSCLDARPHLFQQPRSFKKMDSYRNCLDLFVYAEKHIWPCEVGKK